MIVWTATAYGQPAGSIRGMVYDADFDAPLALAEVAIAETGEKVQASEQGNYVFPRVPPGNYTLVFSKDGYTRKVKANVVVNPGQLTEVDVSLSGEFTDMEEFIVQDLQIGGATEAGLLNLRFESPALLDSIGADLISRAGVSDAADAIKLVAGATVAEGKYAVVRGLPDRYVSSQMNGVRLPTADVDKRAVELDQFPSAVIESIQVSKTFTPDQQGDASGGAVNILLKGIPDQTILQFSTGASFNTQTTGNGDFLTYRGGGVPYWGDDHGSRDIPPLGDSDDPVGVIRDGAPIDYKWSLTAGGKYDLGDGVRIGGLVNMFYERDSAYFENGVDDKLWLTSRGGSLEPFPSQGGPTGDDPESGDFKTNLFDIAEGSQEVKWGGLGTLGLETDHHAVSMIYFATRAAEDKATLAEDTRGKAFYFPGYDVNDPMDPGNRNQDAAPYLRTQTLQYTERTTTTLQFHGDHTFEIDPIGLDNVFLLKSPEFDWTYAMSTAGMYQPDKRQFGSLWWAPSFSPGVPALGIPPSVSDPEYFPFKPAANFTLGNFQRTWKQITEESDQYFLNLKFPFDQWTGDEGYLKIGLFNDYVAREYDQESFSNFNDSGASYEAGWDEFWSDVFPGENHPISAGPPFVDVDYDGEQSIKAWYWMLDLPLTSWFSVIGGIRYEDTDLSIINFPEADVRWVPPGGSTPVTLNPGDADVDYQQSDVLPSIGFEFEPVQWLTVRGSYTETVARQTFKELTPIQQQEFLGSEVFIGNPDLRMSALKNYDLRVDYKPYEGGLVSASYFYKSIEDPIEYVQRDAGFTFTTPVNYPEGELSGFEVEIRQQLGYFWDNLEGLAVGANATVIDAEVSLPQNEITRLGRYAITSRDMVNAPAHLYNINITYDIETTGTQIGLFYTVKGDTLVVGAGGSDSGLIPSVYEEEYGTLNFSIAQKIGEHFKLKFQAKNLTDPTIRRVYRSDFSSDGDRVRSSYSKGIDLSISLSAKFFF